jgi:hypothetical protein
MPWYLSRPRLVTTLCFFAILYIYLNYGSTPVLIPKNSYELLDDDSLIDIRNFTLGVRVYHVFLTPFSRVHILSVFRYSLHFIVVLIVYPMNGLLQVALSSQA